MEISWVQPFGACGLALPDVQFDQRLLYSK